MTPKPPLPNGLAKPSSVRESFRPSRTGGRRRASAPSLEPLERRALLAAGAIEFSTPAFTAADTAGTVPIVLTRTGGSTGAVSVSLATSDGTAVAGTDYNTLTGSVSFPDGVTTETVNLVVIADPVANLPGRTLNLTLSNPSGGVSLGNPSSALVKITHAAKIGDLDGTFGTNGRADVQPGTTASAAIPGPPVLIAPDGSTYCVSVLYITTPFIQVNKVKPDGTVDTSYGVNGLASVAVAQNPALTGATIQPDGKVLAAGTMNRVNSDGGSIGSQFVLARFNTDGTPDQTFGQGGVATLGLSPQYSGSTGGVTVLPGGEIVLAYYGAPAAPGIDLVAFGPDGSPSLTFGTGGIASTTLGPFSAGSLDLLAMPDGTFVVGGSVGSGGFQQPALWRFNADGSMDTAFGSGGFALGPDLSVGYFGYGQPALAPNGDIVQPGTGGAGGRGIGGGTVVFYRNDGSIDTAKGTGGETDFTLGPVALTFQPDGRAVLVSPSGSGTGRFHTVLTRLNADGTLDSTFGQGGVVDDGGNETPSAVAYVPGGKLLVGATTYDAISNNFNGLLELERFLDPSTTPNPSAAFVIGSDGQVNDRPLNASGNPTGGYQLTQYGQTKVLAVSQFGGGQGGYEAFVVGGDNEVYAQTISPTGAHLNGYFATAYGSIASVSSGTDANGNPIMFAIGTDNQLYEQKFDAGGTATSGSYTKAAYGDFKQTILTHDAAGNPLLYATGQDNQVYGLKMSADGTPAGGLFKVGYGPVKQLALGRDAAGNPEVFVIGTDNAVYAHKLDDTGTPLGGYLGLGGVAASIAVTGAAGKAPELFALGTDGQVYGHKLDTTGSPTGAYFLTETIGGGVSAIDAGTGLNGTPELFAVFSNDSQVYSMPFTPAGDPAGFFTLTTTGAVKKVVLV